MTTIMIVEDDKDIATALSIRLKHQGYTVMIAYDPVNGLQKIVNSKPDLVLLDLSMPAGGGMLMAKRMLTHDALPLIPIIVMTASNKQEYREEAEKLGIKYFFEKPFNMTELLDAIKESTTISQ